MSVRRNFDLNQDFNRGMAAVEKEMHRYGLLIVKHASDYLDDNNINDVGGGQGGLKGSLNHRVEEFLNGAAMRVIAGANVPHAAVVHNGRAKNKPVAYNKKAKAFTVLHPWIKRKLGITEEAKIRAVGFAIANKIMKEGTKPKPYMDYALKKVQDSFVRDMQAAFTKGMRGEA